MSIVLDDAHLNPHGHGDKIMLLMTHPVRNIFSGQRHETLDLFKQLLYCIVVCCLSCPGRVSLSNNDQYSAFL